MTQPVDFGQNLTISSRVTAAGQEREQSSNFDLDSPEAVLSSLRHPGGKNELECSDSHAETGDPGRARRGCKKASSDVLQTIFPGRSFDRFNHGWLA